MKNLKTIVALLGLAASSAQARPRETCSDIVVDSVPEVRDTRYSATKIFDLSLSVVFTRTRRFPVPDSIEVKYFAPNGNLYQSVTVPVAADTSTEKHRRLHGHRFPVNVSRAEDGERRRQANRRIVDLPAFPVGGTLITTSSLYGKWRVEAWPEGAPSPCAAAFTIVP